MAPMKKISIVIAYFLITAISVITFIGLIYILFKLAVTDKKFYSIAFLGLITLFLIYKIVKLIIDKKFNIFLYKITKFFSYTSIIFILALLIIMPIALVLRYTVVGMIIEVISLSIFFFCLVKIRPFTLIDKMLILKFENLKDFR